ncbi:hypothetical protein P5V15_003161 [Pogonomyrmex californicus]
MGLLRKLAFLACISFIARTNATCTVEFKDVIILILSQSDGYHAAHAVQMKNSIQDQADTLDKEPPQVVLSHELNIQGSWTIIPMLTYLSDQFPHGKWFFFCLENTVIRLQKLLNVFEKFCSSKNIWIGHILYDHQPTIIHHFSDNKKFKYPNLESGIGMTITLLNSLAKEIRDGKEPEQDFSIDAPYEFAKFILTNKAAKLIHMHRLCVVSAENCATYPRFFHSCSSHIAPKDVYFAVKTCAKYHVSRISVVKKTWAKYKLNIGYFSDAADKNLPEAYVVPNTTTGHCAKTYAILQEASKILKKQNFKWLVIVDDDTILSVSRLLDLLTCYNPESSLAIGERYGYRMWERGYQYLTGGAGIVLSAPLVHKLVSSDSCECPFATIPDDMYLFGHCLQHHGQQIVHFSMFHQAQPGDYPNAYLTQEPISFHRFWNFDPEAIYNDWFAAVDQHLPLAHLSHSEL